jgi:hypothetical protein
MTTAYQANHLRGTFEGAEKRHPDLMERYSGRLAEADSVDEKIEIMRAGLRETFRTRYPMPEGFYR